MKDAYLIGIVVTFVSVVYTLQTLKECFIDSEETCVDQDTCIETHDTLGTTIGKLKEELIHKTKETIEMRKQRDEVQHNAIEARRLELNELNNSGYNFERQVLLSRKNLKKLKNINMILLILFYMCAYCVFI